MEILDQKKLTPSLSIPKPIKFLSRNLERISPFLSIRLSHFIFSKPINFKRPERETYMYKSAQKSKFIVKSINQEVELLTYGYSPKKVLLVHGWAGRSTQLFAFADKLLEKGFMVISFDGPAHGNSSGKKTNMIEFLSTIKEIDEAYGPFVSTVGHSFGASAILNSAKDFLNIKCLVTIGSADKVSKIIQRFTNSLTLKESSGKKLQYFLEKKWNISVDDFAASVAAKQIQKPVLVIHDTLDGDVPVSCAYQIRQNLKEGELFITHGLGHTKILRNKTVVNKAVDFIQKNT